MALALKIPMFSSGCAYVVLIALHSQGIIKKYVAASYRQHQGKVALQHGYTQISKNYVTFTLNYVTTILLLLMILHLYKQHAAIQKQGMVHVQLLPLMPARTRNTNDNKTAF